MTKIKNDRNYNLNRRSSFIKNKRKYNTIDYYNNCNYNSQSNNFYTKIKSFSSHLKFSNLSSIKNPLKHTRNTHNVLLSPKNSNAKIKILNTAWEILS